MRRPPSKSTGDRPPGASLSDIIFTVIMLKSNHECKIAFSNKFISLYGLALNLLGTHWRMKKIALAQFDLLTAIQMNYEIYKMQIRISFQNLCHSLHCLRIILESSEILKDLCGNIFHSPPVIPRKGFIQVTLHIL